MYIVLDRTVEFGDVLDAIVSIRIEPVERRTAKTDNVLFPRLDDLL